MEHHQIPPGGGRSAPADRSTYAWAEAFNAITDWVCIIDTHCLIRRTNPAVKSVLGIPAESVAGKHCHTIMHSASEPPPDCPLPRMLASGRRESTEFKLAHGKWLRITLDPIRNSLGNICGAVHITRDITRDALRRQENDILLRDLKQAIGRIKALNGLIPICSACKKIRDAKGHWTPIETYFESNSNASFSHGICPDCMDRIYGKEPWYRIKRKGTRK